MGVKGQKQVTETNSASGSSKLSSFLIGGLGVVGLFGAFVEQDERGILFGQDPEVFAVSEIPNISNSSTSYPVIWASPNFARTSQRRQARLVDTRQRNIPANLAQGGLPSESSPASSGAGAPLSNLIPNTNPQISTLAAGPSAVGNPNGTASGNGLQNLTPLGQGGGPVGGTIVPVAADPTDPTAIIAPVDPVVPAVPEPASWLLMILGIGALGGALRLQNRKQFKAQVRA